MKVVLTEDVKGLGIAGDIVNVKPGYGRNFLIKENKAVEGTAANIKRAEQIRIDKVKEAADNKRSAEVLAKLLDETTITIREKAGEDGKLFGSVTSKDIAEALKEQKDITIDKRKILLIVEQPEDNRECRYKNDRYHTVSFQFCKRLLVVLPIFFLFVRPDHISILIRKILEWFHTLSLKVFPVQHKPCQTNDAPDRCHKEALTESKHIAFFK